MLRVKAIPGERTRFWVESGTLICVQCSKTFNRRTRHRLMEGGSETVYLHIGDPCPKCNGTLDVRFHVVDISEWNGNGSCGCEYFQISLAPKLSRMPLPEQGGGTMRCAHIRAARDFALDVAIKAHEFDRYRRAKGQREENAA
jgi:hypothetical protein